MSPEAIAVNLIGVDAPSYTPGPAGSAFYSLYWPTGSNLQVWEHNSGGVYQATKVNQSVSSDAAGFAGSSGLNCSRWNSAKLFNVTEVGPMLVVFTRGWYGDLSSTPKIYLIDILNDSITERTLLNPDGMSFCSAAFQNPNADLTSEVHWVQAKLSGSLHTVQLWKCSLDAGPTMVWEDVDRTLVAVADSKWDGTAEGVHGAYAAFTWGGGYIDGWPNVQNLYPHGDYAGNDGTHEIVTQYDAGTGAFDRQCYAVKFDSGGYDSNIANTTVRGDQPATWSCYNVSVNSAKDTACMYVWDTGATPPRYKMFQPYLGTGNEGADTDTPWQQIGQNSGNTPHAVFINAYQYPWS